MTGSCRIEPDWLVFARADIGLRELPGAPTEPRISRWLAALKATWRDDETPWCGTAMAAWMMSCGITPPLQWYKARAWAEWGRALSIPSLGAVVVYSREGGGHVGIVVGRDKAGNIMTIGGNQGDAVSIKPFARERVLAYRWPAISIAQPTFIMPLLESDGRVSARES